MAKITRDVFKVENFIAGWDIRKNSVPQISEEFMDYFVEDKVQGDDDYIKVVGLVALAHEKGYCGSTSEILQFPTKENKETVIVKVTVKGYYYNKYSGEIEIGSWDGIGDASPTSLKNKFIVPHMIRMAETRALGRALRLYLNVPILAAEELGSILEQPPISKSQIKEIKSLMATKKFNKEDMESYLNDVIGRPQLGTSDATSGEADVLIAWLTVLEDKPVKAATEKSKAKPSAEEESEDE